MIEVVRLPVIYIPAALVTLSLIAVYIARNKNKFLASFKSLRQELRAETLTRDTLFAGTGAPKNTDFMLYRLQWPITYRQFRIINLFIGVLFAFVSIKLLNNPKMALAAAAVWYIFAHKFVELRYNKHKSKVDEQAELVLQLLAETYKLTENLIDAIVLVIPSALSPLKEELELLVKEYRLNEDLDVCLRKFADRCDNGDVFLLYKISCLDTP